MPRVTEIIGAAARYSTKKFASAQSQRSAQATRARQVQAWSYWEDTPEVRFGGTWLGNSLGRARLFAGRRMPDGSVEALPPEHRASELVRSIANGATGQSQMLTEFGPHLFVAGEAWVIIKPTEYGEDWHLASIMEVNAKGKALEVEIDGEPMMVPMEDSDVAEYQDNDMTPVAIRVWQPNPRRHIEADSAIFSSFAILDELRLLNAAVAAIAKSRLTGRGILWVPQGTKFPTKAGGADGEDSWVDTLIDVAEIAYSEPDSAAAAVPIVAELPAAFLGQVQHTTFESDFDEMAIKLREETLRRFAVGVEIPAKYMLGEEGDGNHWSAWALEEGAIRTSVEPKLLVICDAYTTQWLHPALGPDDEPDLVVWYDISDLRVKTNRGETSIQLYDRGEITGDALRRETQFDDADKPDDKQRREAIILGIIKNAPSLAPGLLPLLGITMTAPPAEDTPIMQEPAPVELPVDETNAPPDGEIIGGGALLAAADGLVYRALELAGQRIRSRKGRARRPELQDLEASAIHVAVTVSPTEIDEYHLLESAWDRVESIAEAHGVNPDCLTASLDEYVRELLVAGVVYDRCQLKSALNTPCLGGGSEEAA